MDAAKGTPGADGKTVWLNALDLGIEGQGWKDVKHPYDRLPGEAEGVAPAPVWSLSHHSAGMLVRFVTDSPSISARWSLRSERLAQKHMPSTGVSGVDLYAKKDGAWRWSAVGMPDNLQGNEAALVSAAPAGAHENPRTHGGFWRPLRAGSLPHEGVLTVLLPRIFLVESLCGIPACYRIA